MSEQSPHRLDKWLWAARFFKTRRLAKEAIEGGKVHYEGQRTKPSKLPKIGDTLKIRQGYDDREVVIIALSDKRGPAPIAQTLYEETQASLDKRQAETEARKMAKDTIFKRPSSKRQRRQLDSFKRNNQA